MSRRPTMFPCSKSADVEEDSPFLAEEYALIDADWQILRGQHAIRRWEYAMALRTIKEWGRLLRRREEDIPLDICDVGGAGSHFWQILATVARSVILIDPHAPFSGPLDKPRCACFAGTVEEYVASGPLVASSFDVITCISVIEHVAQIRPFFRALHTLLKPGGLLFLTTDYTDTEGDDVFHYHWMRLRIYNADRVRRLLADVRELGFRSFGEADWSYHGPQVFDYSVCSIGLVRKDP